MKNKKILSILISVVLLVGVFGFAVTANSVKIDSVYAERDMLELTLSEYSGGKFRVLLTDEKTGESVEYKSDMQNAEIIEKEDGKKAVVFKTVKPLKLDSIYSVKIDSSVSGDVKYFQLRSIVNDDFESYNSSEELNKNWAYFLNGAYQENSLLELVTENGSKKMYSPYKTDNTVIFPRAIYNQDKMAAGTLTSLYPITNYVIETDGRFGQINDGKSVEFRFVGGQNLNSFGTAYNALALYGGKIGSYTSQNVPIDVKGDYILGANTLFDAKIAFRDGKVNSVLQVMDDIVDETYYFTDTYEIVNLNQCFKFKLTECFINRVQIYVVEEIAEIPESIDVLSMKVNNNYLTANVAKSKTIDLEFNNPVNMGSLSEITLTCGGQPVSVSTAVSQDGKTVTVKLPEYEEWEFDKEYVLCADGVADSTGMRTASYTGRFKAELLFEDDFDYENDDELNSAWLTTNPELKLRIDKDRKAMVIPPQAVGDMYVYPAEYDSQADWNDYYFEYEFVYPVEKHYAEPGASMKYTTILSKNKSRKTGISFRGNGQIWHNGADISSTCIDRINISSGLTGASAFLGDRALADVVYNIRLSNINGEGELVFDRTNEAGTPNGRIYKYSGWDDELSGGIMFESEINVDKCIRDVKVYKIVVLD